MFPTASFLSLVVASAAALHAAPPAIIPLPVKIEPAADTPAFTLRDGLAVESSPWAEAALLALKSAGIVTREASPGSRGALSTKNNPALGKEAYRLGIEPDAITLEAATPAGVYYGTQTLVQAVVGNRDGSSALPALRVEDAPRFSWRGLMLDCSRTFQAPAYLRKTIDRMAAYKMNILHLHLTDDQGWRIEIRKYPELTRKGARFSAQYNEPEAHQGYYTQAEMRDLVRYAAERHITIVPEIEMPGHSLAALACRPDLSCAGNIPDNIFPFGKGPNITTDILCAGNDDTFAFLTAVLDEIAGIFPSEFIHIGGDEAPKDRWHSCPKCQARIKAEGLKDEHELQSWFIRRVEKHINSKGRRLIGWSEILQGGLAPNAAVMDWIGGAEQATRAGHDAVMSPTGWCYFDYTYQTTGTRKVYSFDPLRGMDAGRSAHVLGIQANFWSHIDREPEKVDAQLFPRLLAIAERAWSPAAASDWAEFQTRLDAHLPRLRDMGVFFYQETRATKP